MPTFIACSAARPLLADLSVRPFSGRILRSFQRACTIIDGCGRIITLVTPEIGNGPFSIVVERGIDLFTTLTPDQPVVSDADHLRGNVWSIHLKGANVWEPRLPCDAQPLYFSQAVTDVLRPYTHWPRPNGDTPVTRSTTQRLARAAAAVQHALGIQHGVETAVAQLAGLGQGLTPAGDDYLLGILAALWLTQRRSIIAPIVQAAAPRTTVLSAAFLNAAVNGLFAAPWHALTQALTTQDAERVGQAARHLAQWGASSGRDALAGFATTLSAKPPSPG